MKIKKWWHQRQFQRQLDALAKSEVADIYRPPDITTQRFIDADYLVLDFETTGLSPKNHEVLSAGWTTITDAQMRWGCCAHHFIQHNTGISDQSVAIHHITEQEAAQGQPIADVLPELLKQLSGKILVAHFADIEVGFLQQLVKRQYGITLPLVVIDTLQLVFSMRYKHAVHIPQDALNLFALRAEYQLPRYKAHNARSDAIATAELLLLIVEELGGKETVSIKQLLAMSH